MGVERWGLLSVVVNVLLAAIHLTVARLSGSLAVTAEMVHNMVDVVSSLAVLAGLNIATRKSKRFPYGLYKVENMVAAGVALLTLVTAYEIGKEALLRSAAPSRVDAWTLSGVAVAALLPLVFGHFELRAGQAASSPALIASAKDHRTHVFSSGLVLLALLAQRVALPLDRVAALVVVVLISHSAWQLLLDSARVLLDASLPPDTLASVREILMQEPLVADVRSLTGRNAGRYRFLEAEIQVRTADLERAHEVATRAERSIRKELPNVERVLIHSEPLARAYLWYALPVSDREGRLSPHFGEAPYFLLVKAQVPGRTVETKELLVNPHTEVTKAKGLRVAEWLLQHDVDIVLVREDLTGKGPQYVLGEAGVELFQTDSETWEAAVAGAPRSTWEPRLTREDA